MVVGVSFNLEAATRSHQMIRDLLQRQLTQMEATPESHQQIVHYFNWAGFSESNPDPTPLPARKSH